LDLYSSIFAPNNLLATKIKKLDLSTKLNETCDAKLRIQLKSKWIFFEL